MSKKQTIDALRMDYVKRLAEILKEEGEDVLVVGSNELAIPVVDGEGEEQYIVFKVQVPSGSRDGDAYDGYAMAEDYAMKQREKAAKAAKSAEEKAKKIARPENARTKEGSRRKERREIIPFFFFWQSPPSSKFDFGTKLCI